VAVLMADTPGIQEVEFCPGLLPDRYIQLQPVFLPMRSKGSTWREE
jgi:hypothetical protein